MKKMAYSILILSFIILIAVFLLNNREKNVEPQPIFKEAKREQEDEEMKSIYLENKKIFHYTQETLFSMTKSNQEKISFWNNHGSITVRRDNDSSETDHLYKAIKENRQILAYLEKILPSKIKYVSFSYSKINNEPMLRFELAHTPQDYRSYIIYGNYGFNSQLIENNWYLEVIPNT